MSEIRGVVVAHGRLAHCLVQASEGIAGEEGALLAISNADCGPRELEDRVRTAVNAGPAIVFVDLASGSCAHAALSAARGESDVAVVTGVNLSILLDFVFHRDMALAELTQRLVARGQAGIASFPADSTA